MSSSSSSQGSSSPDQEVQKVKKFLASIPASSDSTQTNVTFESERDSNESDLCRKLPGGGLDCTKVFLSSTKLFAAISKMGYFCTKPIDPASTEIQCTRISEGPLAPELDVGKTSNPVGSIA